jgi:hypothetical protein
MIFNFKNFLLLEKSSLSKLGVPNEVVKILQKNFKLSSKAQWNKIELKKTLKDQLMKDEKALYIEISLDYINIFVNNYNNYIFQKFKYDDSGWGGYIVEEREQPSLTQLLNFVNIEHSIWKCEDDEFEIKTLAQQEVQKHVKKLDYTTYDFKMSIVKNFDNILKRIYGKKHDDVMTKIVSNIETMQTGQSAEELLDFLKDNNQLAKIANKYKFYKEIDDILRIKELQKQYNSLTVFDEYLFTFESEYSDKFNYRVSIKDLIETFGLMKIQNAFFYYLYTGRIKDLTV